jgi:DAPG hydrolase PhiG domain
MRLPILPERPHAGPMKPVASARTSQSILPSGQLELTIKHDTVRRVTPTMLRWWFENLGQAMTFEGQTYPRYLLWHPRDHIHWELASRSPSGGTGQGAHFRIVEAFAADPAYYVDSTERVEKLSEEGIALVRHIAGVEVFRLEHSFGVVEGGTSYNSRMIVGLADGLSRWTFNYLIRPRIFSEGMGIAWLTHNVEEVSMFENILPSLYEAR